MTVVREAMTAGAWLDVWERAAVLPRALRSIELLRPVCEPATGLERMSLGEREALLWDLYRGLFGDTVECTAQCPTCADRCEWSCGFEALCTRARATVAEHLPCTWSGDGWIVRFRPIEARDVEALESCKSEKDAVERLLERCVLEATLDGRPIASTELPVSIVDAVSEAMEHVDPHAAPTVALTCPSCAHQWDAGLDAVTFVWEKLSTWAERTLSEVHELARHYGWSETEILELSAARRSRYLAMVSS